MEKTPVPKFASFKPKPPAKSVPKHDDQVKETRDHSAHKRHRHRSHSRDRRHDHHKSRTSRDSGRSYSHSQTHHGSRDHGTLPDPSHLNASEQSDLWMVDRRGDAKNVAFGGMHRYDVPAYHRIGFGHILGAARNIKIDREASSDKAFVLRTDDRGRVERLLSSKRNIFNGKTQRIVPELGNDSLDTDEDFVALRSSLKRKRSSQSPEPGLHDVDYRSVEGKAKPSSKPADEDLEFSSDLVEAQPADESETRLRAKNAELSRKVKSDPDKIEAWLDLVDYQATCTFPGTDLERLSNPQRRALADIRLSIIDQAFKHIVKGRPGHDRLLCAYINEGSNIWDSSKVLQKWQSAVNDAPQSMTVWKGYLNHVQSGNHVFRYERCKEAFLQSLRSLREIHEQSQHHEQEKITQVITYVFLRYVAFVRDAGYDELALGTWQAVFEYQMFRPKDPVSGESKLTSFEDFWESDVPRIGEADSAGWEAYQTGGQRASRTTPNAHMNEFDGRAPLTRFAENESKFDGAMCLPAAIDDDTYTDDPFRHVMFSDIKPVLQHLPDELPRGPLVNAFLCFMRLPLVHQNFDESQNWASDPYLNTHFLSGELDASASGRPNTLSLFQSAFHAFAERHCENQEPDTVSDTTRFIDRTLQSLVAALPEDDLLAEYWLAFKLATAPGEAAKTAKRLLKLRPSSLRLYNAYALIQARLHGIDKAQDVWTAALGLSHSLREETQDDTILLPHSSVSTLIHAGSDAAALQCLLAIPDEQVVASTQMTSGADVSAGRRLRASKHLEEGFDQMDLKRKPRLAVLYVDCLAWLYYLLNDHNPDSALQIYDKYSPRLSRSSKQGLELLHQSKASFLALHMARKRPFKPSSFRSHLDNSRKLFPENSLILSTYYRIAALTRIDDRLRTAISDSESPTSRKLIAWTYAIQDEIQRCSTDGAMATQESVRSLFRLALLSPDSLVSCSARLWRMWLRFELAAVKDNGTLVERKRALEALQRAKQVVSNGMGYLPWCKGWMLEGVQLLQAKGGMDEVELRRVYDFMVESELRVRVDVER